MDRRPSNENELYNILEDAWNALPVIYLTTLADSMPHRIEAVLKNRGWPTKY